MNDNNKKYRSRALTGTILFHLLLLVFFMFFGLSTPLPLPEEEGVLVDFGYSDEGIGESRPLSAPQPTASPAEAQPEPAREEVVTQDVEESVSIPDTESPQPVDEPEPDRREEPVRDEIPEIEEEVVEEEPDPTPDPRAMFPGNDERTADQESKGDTGRPGDLGRPDGSEEGDGAVGGGRGSGVEFSLSGRSATHLPMPDYTSPETGRVVVSITVNRQGQVIRANAGARGTTTTDRNLWKQAEEAAMKARFDRRQDASEEQRGTITYNFIRLN